MNKLALLAAIALGALLACGNTANAQEKKTPKKGEGQTVERQLERLTKALELTDAQKPKVKAALEETQKKRLDLANETTAPRDRRARMTALVEEQDKKLKAILTPGQFEKLQRQRAEARERAKNKAPEGRKKKASTAS